MKPNAIATLVVAMILPVAQALADGGEHSKKEMKLLKDSAAALQTSNPALAGKLKSYATKEAGEKEETESKEAETDEKQDVQMLRDSAAALKTTRPDLAKGLRRYAEKEEKERHEESEEHEHGRSPVKEASPMSK